MKPMELPREGFEVRTTEKGVVIAGMVAAKNGWCPAILAALFPYALFLALGIRAFWKQR